MTETNHPVLYQLDGSVARITLNRPEKRNALSDNLIAALKDSMKRAGDDEARVVIIKGAGSDFCSGADLSALQKIADSSIADNAADARSLMEVFMLIRDIPIPVVAAVHGRALAGGCGLASACDIVLASASARFGYEDYFGWILNPLEEPGSTFLAVCGHTRNHIYIGACFKCVAEGKSVHLIKQLLGQ